MTDRRARFSRILFGLVLCLPVANPGLAQQAAPAGVAARPATDEFAARGQREARSIRYGDWQKFCFKPGGAKTVCRTTISGTFETGQIAVRVYVTEREGDSTARLQLFMPVGLYMPPGVKLTVDKGAAHKIPFTWCLTNTAAPRTGGRQEPLVGGRRYQPRRGNDFAAARSVRGGEQGNADPDFRTGNRRIDYVSPAAARSTGSINAFAVNGLVK
jgi:invasion protein IalB